MSRRLAVILGLVGIAVVLVALQASAPVDATGCARPVPTDLHSDGEKRLLLWGKGCTEGEIYVYSERWHEVNQTNVRYKIPEKYSRRIRIFAPAPDGGWWFVSNDGRAHLFSSNLRYQNRTRKLPFYGGSIDWEEYLTGFAIDSRGYWWITTNERTFVVEPTNNETVRTLGRGASDIVIRNDRVLFLRTGQKGGIVREYVVRETPEGVPTLHERGKYEIGPEVFNPSVLFRGSDGKWWVYSRYDTAYAYDQHWRYTGERHPSGSVLGGVLFLFPPLLVSVVGFWLLSWRAMMDYLPRRLLGIYVGSASLAATLSVTLRESLVPPSMSFVYWPSDPLVAALLVLPTAFGGYLLERRSLSRVLLVAVANLPLLVVAWDFWTSAG